MNTDFIILREYCECNDIELDFIVRLEEEGLLDIIRDKDRELLLHISQLSQLEHFYRLHYDLSVNIEGIAVIDNLLHKIEEMQYQMNVLEERLNVFDFE